MSWTVVRSASWSTSMREEAKWTLTDSTPSSRPTRFSILATQEGQEKPSARRTVWVRVGALMSCSFQGMAWLVVSNLRLSAVLLHDARQLTARPFPASCRVCHHAGAADGHQEIPDVEAAGVVRHLHPAGSQIDVDAVDVAEAEEVVDDVDATRGAVVAELEDDAGAGGRGHGQAVSMTILPAACPGSTAAGACPACCSGSVAG